MSHQCNAECVSGWSPGRRCHCAGCSQNFSSVRNFDLHRINDKCVDPSTVGLVKNDRGTWTQEGETDFHDRLQGKEKA